MGLMVILSFLAAQWAFGDFAGVETPVHLALTVLVGLGAGWAIGFTSEYFTSDHYQPVKDLAGQSGTGPTTVVIGGIALGTLSTAPAVILVVAAVGASYWLGEAAFSDAFRALTAADAGLYGVALAAVGMLATTGIVVAVDAYGPIADNTGGIAEMAELPPEVRTVTDSLDSLGNTTAAITKGFAIGSAAVTAFALWRLGQRQEVHRNGGAGRQGFEAHKAAVVGDTVGDPFKDTSGPAVNILIKVMTIVSLVFVPAFT